MFVMRLSTVSSEDAVSTATAAQEQRHTTCCAVSSTRTVQNSTESDRAHWTFGDTVTLRGHGQPTTLAPPV
jgi:adenylate cyclase